MNVTLDTNFLISATQWETSVAHKLLISLIKSDIPLFSTQEILDEFGEVLQRDFHYSADESYQILKFILTFIMLVEPQEKIDAVKTDPDDNKILECAVASKSQYILTYDRDLLDLKEFKGIRIIKPEDAFTIF